MEAGERCTKRRVLVVDDNEWSVKLLRMLLVAAGHEVAGAGDAQQALSLAASFKPQLILLDLELPDMGGLALARLLKAGSDTRTTPIVVVTAHAAEDVAPAVRAAGCDGLLTKPVDPATLAETVRRYCPD